MIRAMDFSAIRWRLAIAAFVSVVCLWWATPANSAASERTLQYAYSPDGPWSPFDGNSQNLNLKRLLETHFTVWFRMELPGRALADLQLP